VRQLAVALVGEESAGLRALRLIEGSGHRLAAVLTSPPAAGGRERGAATASLWRVAETAGHPTFPAAGVGDPELAPALARRLRDEGVDLLLNVHSLHVVRPEVLRAPRMGSFNLHPGPLPAYAGLDTVSWALYRGETEYGVTVHEMTERIDAGGIAFRASFPIGPGDTAFSLYARCIREGLTLLGRLLETAAARDRVPVEPQDLGRRRYFARTGPPLGGRLDWRRSAREVHDFVRACDYGPFPSPWGRPRTTLASEAGTRELELLETALTGRPAGAPPGTIEATAAGGRSVACTDEWLEVRVVRADGRRRPSAAVLEPGGRLE
jgi:methionyl-tRNA formyltransferase